jgi:trans-2,3-dihydro-3-hydroxyanthranilate isomerase
VQHPYILADVFTDQPFGGNQLAVFPDADNIPFDVMPKLSRELNLSESVFVLKPEDPEHTCRLRILTPAIELPFAGHPTVGAACVLAAIGRIDIQKSDSAIFEEVVGPVPVQISRDGDLFSAKFRVPQTPEPGPELPDPEALARMLSLEASDLRGDVHMPRGFSCGVPFAFITVKDKSVLARIRFNTTIWEEVLADHWAHHVYVISHDPELQGSAVRARMFAPAMQIPEDPATGAAASALVGYLSEQGLADGSYAWRIEQGFEMGRPSLIDVEAEIAHGSVRSIQIGGNCVIVGHGEFDV